MNAQRPACQTLPNPSAQPDTASFRILVIDDHPPFRQTLAHLLRRAGYTVEEADNGVGGLASLGSHPTDLVITDRDMPGLSGWDVARLAKGMEPGLPVVLVTGGIDTRTTDRQDRSYVDAILWKPFSFTHLLDLIGQLIGHKPITASPAGGGTRRRSPAWPPS